MKRIIHASTPANIWVFEAVERETSVYKCSAAAGIGIGEKSYSCLSSFHARRRRRCNVGV